MKKKVKVLGITLLVFFVVIQFYRPGKNMQQEITMDDFLITEKPPTEVVNVFKNSCYNCHSNHTNYFWYDNIAPASWLVDNHVNEGKLHLNFSKWATLSTRDKTGLISQIASQITEDKMPLPAYLKIHPDAAIDESEKQMVMDWMFSLD